MSGSFRRAFAVLCGLVLVACELNAADRRNLKHESAVQGGAKGWQPSAAPETRRSDRADGGAIASSKPNARDAAARDARAASAADDDLDAGAAPSKPADMTDHPPCAAGRTEICNTIDDDCDKKVDEDCECPSDEPVACYDGPAGTLDVGVCRAGTRSCAQGVLGPCVDAVLPSEEICNDLDDDCNGEVDDLPSLKTDTMNCGRCGQACARGESCCDGRCVNPRGEDVDHCGGCGMACSEGRMPGCCAGRCVDLLSDQTCGACNMACGLLRLGGGFVCRCTLTAADGPRCTAQMNNQQWLCQ